MKITVKGWFGDKIKAEMKKYNLSPTFEYVKTEAGVDYYKDTKNDTVTMNVVEKVGESEKAIKVMLDCETRDFDAHDPWTAWIPKSQIVEIK